MKIERITNKKKRTYVATHSPSGWHVCERFDDPYRADTRITLALSEKQATEIMNALNNDPANVDEEEIVIRLSKAEADLLRNALTDDHPGSTTGRLGRQLGKAVGVKP